MAFDKQSLEFHERTKFDIDNESDKKIIREFEMELSPYLAEKKSVLGKELSGIILYLHEKGLFKFSKKYPDGAVNGNRLYDYRITMVKIKALRELWDRRYEAKKSDEQNINNLIATAEPSIA